MLIKRKQTICEEVKVDLIKISQQRRSFEKNIEYHIYRDQITYNVTKCYFLRVTEMQKLKGGEFYGKAYSCC
jgi:hypothetical protein